MIRSLQQILRFYPAGALVWLLVCAATASAQDGQCSLKLAEIPAIPEFVGFRLGMTPDQVRTRVAQVVIPKADELGVAKTSINPDFDSRIDKSSFQGVRTVSLDFLDDRLTSLWLGYDGTFKWQTLDDFVKGISQSLHLPNAWSPWRLRGQRLRCADFEIIVSMLGEGPSFRILNLAAEDTIAARRQAKEDERAAEEEHAEQVVGDKKSKLFYLPECRPSNGIKETDRVVFSNREEAEKAGYKLASQCE